MSLKRKIKTIAYVEPEPEPEPEILVVPVAAPTKKQRFLEGDVGKKHIDLELFQIYKSINGDLKIPARFVIPVDERWPEDSHNKLLGRHTICIRNSINRGDGKYRNDQVEALLEMGFLTTTKDDANEVIIRAYQRYTEIYGTTDITRSFRIPKAGEVAEQFPIECRGMHLGNVLNNIRTNKSRTVVRDALAAIGFKADPCMFKLPFEQIYEILKIYREQHGDLEVNQHFAVPQSEEYPSYAWGFKLGGVVCNIRRTNAYAEHKDKLLELGFRYQMKYEVVRRGFDAIYDGIVAYKNIHGNTKIPAKFVIPTDDERFPEHTHKIKLGSVVSNMRGVGSHFEHKEKLLELGIVVKDKYAPTFTPSSAAAAPNPHTQLAPQHGLLEMSNTSPAGANESTAMGSSAVAGNLADDDVSSVDSVDNA